MHKLYFYVFTQIQVKSIDPNNYLCKSKQDFVLICFSNITNYKKQKINPKNS